MLLISLIGEQPIPNLLPARYLKAENNLLVATKNEKSYAAARRLSGLIQGCEIVQLKEEYIVPDIVRELSLAVGDRKDVTVNLTGGTKPMALAAFELAVARKYSCVYYRTEGKPPAPQISSLYFYGINSAGELELERTQPLSRDAIKLKEYIEAHFGSFTHGEFSSEDGGMLEREVANALKPYVDELFVGVIPLEMKGQLEADIIIRCENQVAIFEVKTGGEGSGKKAVDQLTTFAARELMGTYTQRFIVTQFSRNPKHGWFKPVAGALGVSVVELNDYYPGKPLSKRDVQTLVTKIANKLPIRRGLGESI
ncbi:MAG TPA: DUF1887 family CARF protein [Anaerolineaceae bacterium]|nr:DUF1887 family CARF protein [Anaerolineaceae bacterium]HPN53859.1 DUF1887 family CARF protein [Anaerolineaceae bacterium]